MICSRHAHFADAIAADKTHLEMRCPCVVKWIPIGLLPRVDRIPPYRTSQRGIGARGAVRGLCWCGRSTRRRISKGWDVMGLTQPANRIMIPGQRLAHASKAQAAHKSASPVRLEGETKPGRPCGPLA